MHHKRWLEEGGCESLTTLNIFMSMSNSDRVNTSLTCINFGVEIFVKFRISRIMAGLYIMYISDRVNCGSRVIHV